MFWREASRRRRVALVVTLAVLAASGATPAVAAAGDTTRGHGIDAGNRNVSGAAQLALPLRQVWNSDLPPCFTKGRNVVRTISVADGMVYTAHVQWKCGYLSAYDALTGTLKWRATGGWGTESAVYHDGAIYWAHLAKMSEPQLTVLDAKTGERRWSKPVQWSGVAVGDGVVLNGDTAYDSATGAVRWNLDERTNSAVNPTVVGGVAYLNNGPSVRAVNAATGKVLWRYHKTWDTTKPGSGSARPAVHGGRVYVRSQFDATTTLVLDAATGRYIKRLPASEKPFAFTGTTMIGEPTESVNGAVRSLFVSNIDTTTGTTRWTRKLPLHSEGGAHTTVLRLAPLINGNLVWAATGDDTTSAGRLFAYDLRTGKVRWSTALPCTVGYDNDHPGSYSNLAVAHGHLYVPTFCGILAFKAAG